MFDFDQRHSLFFFFFFERPTKIFFITSKELDTKITIYQTKNNTRSKHQS
ncbi:hypothetical protein Hanom_Chr11g01063951 [Helianthus anomalus]